MELRQIRQFVTLAETLNFHRAAEALNMTQPPFSVSIHKLEAELGAALFHRSARGVRLTEAGEAALPAAREALTAVRALTQAVRETAAGERASLRVGFAGSATYGLVPAIVPRFRERHPGIDLHLKEATSLEVVRELEAGVLDCGLVRTPLLQAASLTLEPLYREALMLLAPIGHRLGRGRVVRLEDLKDEPFILYDRQQVPNLYAQTLMACEAAGFLPKVAEEAAHVHTIIALVESRIGVALVPAVMRRAAEGRVRSLELTAGGAPLQIGFALATRTGDRRPAVAAFAAVAKDAAAAI